MTDSAIWVHATYFSSLCKQIDDIDSKQLSKLAAMDAAISKIAEFLFDTLESRELTTERERLVRYLKDTIAQVSSRPSSFRYALSRSVLLNLVRGDRLTKVLVQVCNAIKQCARRVRYI